MDIILDFDGTVVSNEFPQTGEDIGAVPVIKELVECGASPDPFYNSKEGCLQDN